MLGVHKRNDPGRAAAAQAVELQPAQETVNASGPTTLGHEYANAPKGWCWQWVLPRESRWKNMRTGEEGPHHIHEMILRRDVKEVVRKAGIVKHPGCHTCRHAFAAPPLEGARIFARSKNVPATKTSAQPSYTPRFERRSAPCWWSAQYARMGASGGQPFDLKVFDGDGIIHAELGRVFNSSRRPDDWEQSMMSEKSTALL